jgi:hypothetical protein
MKYFNSLKEFKDFNPSCLFCNYQTRIVALSNIFKFQKIVYGGIINQRIPGVALYRASTPFGLSYNYFFRFEKDKIICTCTEKYYGDAHPPQVYDVMSIDVNTSIVDLNEKVEVGILNSFVRINFRFAIICSNLDCSGYVAASSPIIAGAKSKKIMPFFLKDEYMSQTEVYPGDNTIYKLHSDYYLQTTYLSKIVINNEDLITLNLLSDAPGQVLPLVELFNIKNKEIFQNRVENYVTFS